MVDSLYEYQSLRWDMNISLEELLSSSIECQVDRSYKAHKHDDCFNGYCIYLKHPQNDKYNTMIGIWEDGFAYLGDGENKDLPFEKTFDVIPEIFFYGEWIKTKEKCLNKTKSNLQLIGIFNKYERRNEYETNICNKCISCLWEELLF